jgi:dihydroorotate dehydrogenase (NAD+) catalytic subunit
LIVKLTPNVTDIASIARVVEAAGADALAVINTVRGMSIDVERFEPRLGNTSGGLSGAAIRPIAVLAVWEVARAVRIPIVGQGGIETARDALEFILAGASAVSIGTGNFTDPRAPLSVVDGLRAYMQEKKIARLADLVGRANPGFGGMK